MKKAAKKKAAAKMPADKRLKLDVAKYLAALGDGAKPKDKECGICFNLDEIFPPINTYLLVQHYAKAWPKCSSDPRYPVMGEAAYDTQANKWSGRHGRLRRELCMFIAKKLRSEVRAGNYSL